MPNETPTQRFLPREHLRSPADFRLVYERRRSVSDEWLIVYARVNGLPYSRVGLSVSKKVGGAVQRNRFRRLYREAYRLTRPELAVGLDLIMIPKKTDPPSLEDLKQSLPRLVAQVAKRLAREGK